MVTLQHLNTRWQSMMLKIKSFLTAGHLWRAGAAREGGPLLDLLNCPILFLGLSKTLENGFGCQSPRPRRDEANPHTADAVSLWGGAEGIR